MSRAFVVLAGVPLDATKTTTATWIAESPGGRDQSAWGPLLHRDLPALPISAQLPEYLRHRIAKATSQPIATREHDASEIVRLAGVVGALHALRELLDKVSEGMAATLRTGREFGIYAVTNVAELPRALGIQVFHGRWPQGAVGLRDGYVHELIARMETASGHVRRPCATALSLAFFVEDGVYGAEHDLELQLVVTILPNPQIPDPLDLPLILHRPLLGWDDRHAVEAQQPA